MSPRYLSQPKHLFWARQKLLQGSARNYPDLHSAGHSSFPAAQTAVLLPRYLESSIPRHSQSGPFLINFPSCSLPVLRELCVAFAQLTLKNFSISVTRQSIFENYIFGFLVRC